MSTMTSTGDQDAIRVANRYASLIEKAQTLTARARACETAAQQYRADARANQESADNHRQTARTIRNPALARQHAEAARDAEAEAAREILAARAYEIQAETYVAQANGAGPAAGGTTLPALDAPHRAPGHYDGVARPVPSGAAATRSCSDDTGKEAMTASDTGALPDTARLTEKGGEHWHGSDVVTAASGDGTVSLGRCQYPDSAAYVVVATSPPDRPWDPDSSSHGTIDPTLSRKEAEKLADTLDELAGLAESGATAKPPTRLEKVAARVRGLIGTTGVTIIGTDGEIEVSAADIRKLLAAAAPEPAAATRRKVDAKDCAQDSMDTGTVWAELDTSGDQPVIAVTSTEGETPEEFPEGYTTTRLSPTEARQLADKVRRFSATPDPAGTGQPAPAADSPDQVGEQVRAAPAPAPAGPRRVTSPAGRTYEYDPDSGETAIIEPDGWRAVVPPSSTTGVAARLLDWRNEIKQGRGQDASTDGARALLAAMTGAELREVTDAIGLTTASGRTKPQLTDAIVNAAVASPLKHRGLAQGWW